MVAMAGPRSEPPIPMLTTAAIRLPVAPVQDPLRMRSERSPILAEHRLHVADDVLAVDVQLAAGRHAQRHVEDGAVLGRVDVLAGEHGVAMLLDLGGPGHVHEEAQRLVGRPLLGVVEDEVGRRRRHARRPLGVVREELAQVPRRDLLVVRRQRLPLGCRREVHGRQSTARRAPACPPTGRR